MGVRVKARALPSRHASGKMYVDLGGYVEDIRCPGCRLARNAGDFLKTGKRDALGTFWLSGGRLCVACEPPPEPLPFEPGMRIRSLRRPDGTPARWRARTADGPFGRHHAMREMHLRIMTGTNEIRPQPKPPVVRRRAAQRTLALA